MPILRKNDRKEFDKTACSGFARRDAKEVPFWLMRQAGRYLPEYRALREKAGGFLDLVFNPDRAAEATMQPVRRFNTDAAFFFRISLSCPRRWNRTLPSGKVKGRC